MGMDWKQALLAAGATVGVVAALHYLLKEEEESESNALAGLSASSAGDEGSAGGSSGSNSELEMIHKILDELFGSQDKLKSAMGGVSKELIVTPHTFDEVYQRVKAVQPSDPLEECGLSMEAFDQLVSKHQNDPKVHQSIMRMMGAASPSSKPPSKKATETTIQTLVDVHKFMAEGLTAVVADVEASPNKTSLDPKTAMMAAQTVVAAKVETKFGLTSEDLEAAIMANQAKLQTSQEFAMISQEMQVVMTKLMNAVGAGGGMPGP